MRQHLLSPFGFDELGADAEITIEIDPRTGQRRRVHRLPPAPPGFALLNPATRLDLRQAMMSRTGRQNVKALINQLDNTPARFRGDGDDFGSDGYGADAGDELGAELDELSMGAETAAASGDAAAIVRIMGRLNAIEQVMQGLQASGQISGSRIGVLWQRASRLKARAARMSVNRPIVVPRENVGLDYQPSPAGSDMEFPYVDSSGNSVITATVGTPVTVTFSAPAGVIGQLKSFRYRKIGTGADMAITSALINSDGLLNTITGTQGTFASAWEDADVGKRPALRQNPRMIPAVDTSTVSLSPIGAAAATCTFQFSAVLAALSDAVLGERVRPVGR